MDITTTQEQEISLRDMLNFFNENIKKIAICGAAGIVLSVATYFSMEHFSASAIVTNDSSLDFVLLKRLQNELPRFAEREADRTEFQYLRELSNEDWWLKNFKPTYAITKVDIKDVQELSAKENRILSFSLSTAGHSEKEAREKIGNIIDFFKRSSTLIMAKDLFQRYNLDVESRSSELEKNEQGALVEINYMKKKAKILEEFKNRFQLSSATVSSQFLDPKESGSKYLPINTQLIAIYADIAAQNETIERIKDERSFLTLKNKITNEFENSTKSNNDGFTILADVRKKINSEIKMMTGDNQEDMRTSMALKKIDSEIAGIQSRFQTGLGERTPIQIKRFSLLKYIAIGTALGLIMGLLYALTNAMRIHFTNEMKKA